MHILLNQPWEGLLNEVTDSDDGSSLLREFRLNKLYQHEVLLWHQCRT